MASRSLDVARQKGLAVSPETMARVDEYTEKAAVVTAASAGVSLTRARRPSRNSAGLGKGAARNAREIDAITAKLTGTRFVTGFGSTGGEEFSLLSQYSLHRAGGAARGHQSSDSDPAGRP